MEVYNDFHSIHFTGRRRISRSTTNPWKRKKPTVRSLACESPLYDEKKHTVGVPEVEK